MRAEDFKISISSREMHHHARQSDDKSVEPLTFKTGKTALKGEGDNFPVTVSPVRFHRYVFVLSRWRFYNLQLQLRVQSSNWSREIGVRKPKEKYLTEVVWGISKDSPHCLVFTRFLFFSSSILARFHNCHNSSTRLIWKITSTES